MLCCPQHKSQKYLKAEGTKLYEKETPLQFDFKHFQQFDFKHKENMKIFIRTWTMSIYPKIN